MDALSDEQLADFDPQAQVSAYESLLADLRSSAEGAEALKPPDQARGVIERHMWASWLKRQRELQFSSRTWGIAAGTGVSAAPDYSVGSDIEVGLNMAGVSYQAGVTLTGHWYSSNQPGDWKRRLLDWAHGYGGTLRI